ncbi:MAG: Ig-like domain-containing protein [Bacteroidales bacterium]|nr:Ig-like domain-containing protein [Bacteroidales bacterium]
MKKLFRVSFAAFAAALFSMTMISCGPDDPDPSTGSGTGNQGGGGTQTVAVAGVSVSKSTLSLTEGFSETLSATVSPDNATNKAISWKSSDTGVATVDNSGKVTAVKAGSATITVTTTDGSKTATCAVTVMEAARIEITGNTAKIPVQGGEAEFPIQYNTSYTVDIDQSVTPWLHFVETRAMQSGKLVFSVDANGGEARSGKATVKANEGDVEPITLIFEQEAFIPVSSVQFDKETAEIEVGETLALTATVLPEDATDKTVVWATDNEAIAAVSEDGVVTGVAVGTATVTANIGELGASVTVSVIPTVQERERAALIALYNATGGDGWTHKDNWCSDKPLGEWYGVGSDGFYVRSITLNSNNLTGKIPTEIFSLPHLNHVQLNYNNFTGEIPPEVGNAKELLSLFLRGDKLTGTIPETIYDLPKLYAIELDENQLSGELSEKFWDMPELYSLALQNNRITGTLTPAVAKAKKLDWLSLGNNLLKGTIPEEITELTNLRLFSIDNLEVSNGSITTSANEFTGALPDNLDKLQNLQYFLVANNNLEGSVPGSFARMPNLIGLKLYGNKFSGEIPEEMVDCVNWNTWAPDRNIMPQQSGYTLSFDYYQSTDFSRDKRVIKLQTHDKGNGINIVITGDCFTDRDIAAGEFEAVARQTMEDFFGVEPFTTFRDLFDVYAVVAVSKTRYSSYGTALGAVFGEGSYVSCDEKKVREYSNMAVKNLDETLTIVIVNKNSNSGTANIPYPAMDTDYGSGFSYACFGLQEEGDNRRMLINHEANGHGFTKLHDEYFFRGGSPFPEDYKQDFADTYFSKGYAANVDFESDPKKVKWARFLSDERYKYDGLGVFEGGMTYEKGVWRPSENSIMAHQSPTGEGSRFNAPSRMAAYYRIHKLAYGSSWKFDYEEFVKYDAINRKTSASPARATGVGAIAPVPHTPPVIMGPNK